MLHKKEDFILHNKKYWRCICADKELAVFARVSKHRNDSGYKTHFMDLFATGQKMIQTIKDIPWYQRFHRGKQPSNFPNPKNIHCERIRSDYVSKKKAA